MFGERYFATRQRLTDVVIGVRELGNEVGTDLSQLDDEKNFFKELRRPFLFLVAGEVNAGKSTLLNGLFGKEFCPVSDLPETTKIQRYAWGEKVEDVEVQPVQLDCLRPLEFLRDFNVIDTPGMNSALAEHHAVMDRLLPTADLLLFVFSVDNPWEATTWQVISKLPEDQLQNVALVLQQTDLKNEADVEVILEHMRTLSEQKTGVRPVVYPVSGNLAMTAKKSQPMTSHLWRKSGFPALEAFITRRVLDNVERGRMLGEVRDSTQSALRDIEEKIESRTANLDSDQRFLRELENEVDVRRENQAMALSSRLSGLADVFLKQGEESAELLLERTALRPSFVNLFKKEALPSEIEKGLTEAVKESVQEKAVKDGVDLVQNCRNHWKTVEPRIGENLAVNPPDFEKETDNLSGTRQRFERRLGRSAKQAVAQLKIRGTLDLQMENRRAVLRRFMIGILCCLIVAGLLGGSQIAVLPWLVVLVALGLLGAGAIFAHKSRKLLWKDFVERIEDLRQPFANSLADDYKDGVREFYVEYGGLFEIVRRRIADQQLLLKPQLERWNDLFLEVKAIEQEI